MKEDHEIVLVSCASLRVALVEDFVRRITETRKFSPTNVVSTKAGVLPNQNEVCVAQRRFTTKPPVMTK